MADERAIRAARRQPILRLMAEHFGTTGHADGPDLCAADIEKLVESLQLSAHAAIGKGVVSK